MQDIRGPYKQQITDADVNDGNGINIINIFTISRSLQQRDDQGVPEAGRQSPTVGREKHVNLVSFQQPTNSSRLKKPSRSS